MHASQNCTQKTSQQLCGFTLEASLTCIIDSMLLDTIALAVPPSSPTRDRGTRSNYHDYHAESGDQRSAARNEASIMNGHHDSPNGRVSEVIGIVSCSIPANADLGFSSIHDIKWRLFCAQVAIYSTDTSKLDESEHPIPQEDASSNLFSKTKICAASLFMHSIL